MAVPEKEADGREEALLGGGRFSRLAGERSALRTLGHANGE